MWYLQRQIAATVQAMMTTNLSDVRGRVAAILFPTLAMSTCVCTLLCSGTGTTFLQLTSVADACVHRCAALCHIQMHQLLHVCLGMDCGNRAGNVVALGDEAEQRRHGCCHLSQHFAHAKCSMPCCVILSILQHLEFCIFRTGF